MYKLTPSKSADDILLKKTEFFDNIEETVKPLLSKSSDEIYSSDFEEDEEKVEEKATEPEEIELEEEEETMTRTSKSFQYKIHYMQDTCILVCTHLSQLKIVK